MKFSHTIIYVGDVKSSMEFYKRAFGLETRFIHESGLYGELETGSTTLAFSQKELVASFLDEYIAVDAKKPPLGIQISLHTPDVDAAYLRALEAGAVSVAAPRDMPWEWRVAFVRDRDGMLVELTRPLSEDVSL